MFYLINMNKNKLFKESFWNGSLFHKTKIIISDLFHKNPYIPYPWNKDNIKMFNYDEQIMTDNFAFFPFCFKFDEYLPLKTCFLTDTNFILLFHLDNNKSFGFDVYSDSYLSSLYVKNEDKENDYKNFYDCKFNTDTKFINAVEFFDSIIDDKSRLYSIKEKKQLTLNYLLNLSDLIKETYLNNPNCFELLCNKFHINFTTLELINDFTLKLKDKFIFDFSFSSYDIGLKFNEKDENIILSFYESLNINEDNYQSFIANKEQIKVLKYFDELSFDYKLRPNTLYCRELKDYLKYDGYNQLYFKLLRLFFMKIDFIPFFETFTEEQKQKLLEEHINFENHLKLDDMNLEKIQIYEYCQCCNFHQIELDVFDYDDLINFHKIFLYDKLTKSLKPKENTSYNRKLKI